jgi:hypothetical protein
LNGSLYYPASGFDGRPVQLLGGFLHSFIYVDYGVGREGLAAAIESAGFCGYRLAGRNPLKQTDLAPNGWHPTIPERFHHDVARFQQLNRDWVRPPFAEWLVFDRLADFGEDHGPERFSLLYVGADGVATYQALYLQNRAGPEVLAIIQPGTGFGGAYTDFRDPQGFLADVVLRMGQEMKRQER